MCPVSSAVRAEFLQLETVGVVTTILLGDVIAVLALHTGQGDLGPDIGGLRGHGLPSFRFGSDRSDQADRGADQSCLVFVAMAGLEPATQRL